jgi:DNA topoisomerase-1
MEYKLGRGGVFMSCKRYPDCLGARTETGAELKPDEPIGVHPDTGLPIFVRTGRFGPYVEMPLETPKDEPAAEEPKKQELTKSGKPKKTRKKKIKINAKRASIPAGTDLATVTLADAVKYLSLPRKLGMNPDSGKPVTASTGRFGPYVAHDGEFRSIKKHDPYTITLEEALAILREPKRPPRGVEIVREIGKHPKSGKSLVLYKTKQRHFLKKGLRRIYLPDSADPAALTPEEAAEYLK